MMTFRKEDALFIYTDKVCSATEDWKGNTATGMNDRHYSQSGASQVSLLGSKTGGGETLPVVKEDSAGTA